MTKNLHLSLLPSQKVHETKHLKEKLSYVDFKFNEIKNLYLFLLRYTWEYYH